jgi:hypothetical protein
MKAQWQDDALRLRVDEGELARLLAGERLRLQARLHGRPLFALELRVGEALAFSAGECWQCVLPSSALHDYAATLPRRDPLLLRPDAEDAGSLRLDFEVDVRDSRKLRGPAGRDRTLA